MSYEDYSEQEIEEIIHQLLNTYYSHLIKAEIMTLDKFLMLEKLDDVQRDWLIAIYDRVRDGI